MISTRPPIYCTSRPFIKWRTQPILRSSPENLLVPERISSKILVVNTVQNLAENSENSCNTENSCNWYDYFI